MCLVTDNLKLVHYTVRKYFRHVVNTDHYEDYVQIGNIGLMKAAKTFDINKGFTFSTLAIKFIWGEIARFERDSKNLIKTPQPLYNNTSRYNRVCYEYFVKNNEYPSDIEVVALSGMTLEEVIEHRQYVQAINYIEATGIKDDCNYNLVVTDHKEKEINFDLERAINTLSDIDKKVVMLYYYEDCNQPKIAKTLGINQVNVSRRLARAKRQIREFLGDNYVYSC